MGGYERALELWRRKNIVTDAELAEALNAFGIAFAYYSGKIENENVTYHDTREIFEHDGVTAYTGDLRTLFEIRNARDAYELFLCAFRDPRGESQGVLRCAGGVGCPTGAGTAAGVSQAADGKDLGEAGQAGREAKRVTVGEGVLVVLFRIVHITPTDDGGKGPR